MDITAYPQIPSDVWKSKYGNAHKYRLTLECYDQLVKEGYRPSDMGRMMVTMSPYNFAKLVEDGGGACSTKTTDNGRVSSVWWRQVEISCYEETKNTYNSWTLDEEWKKL